MTPSGGSFRAPFRHPTYRALWIASLVSYLGIWMQEVGAAWLMTSLTSSPTLVAAVQSATTLPIVLLALAGGALADVVDRRRLLIAAQAWMLAASAALAALTFAGAVTPPVLLALVFTVGLGAALHAPAWQAIVPDLVDRQDLGAALALNGAGINLARAAGPALGGLVVSSWGPGASFLINAVSYAGVIGVLHRWRSPARASLLPAERLFGAMAAGMRYARHAPDLHAVLARAFLFILSGSAVWALLPVVVRFELRGGPGVYGLLVGCLGLGAVAGAALLPPARSRFPARRLAAGATVLYAAAVAGVATANSFLLIGLALVGCGAAWLALLTLFHAGAQTALASWVRGRGLAVFFLVFFAGMAGGSALWGAVATVASTRVALLASAAGLLCGMLATLRMPLPEGGLVETGAAARRAGSWSAAVDSSDIDRGPVLVTVEYRIAPEDAEAFGRAMREVQRFRLRDGAVRWHLLIDPEDPGRWVESFLVESLAEHLRQHERVTAADRLIEAAARRFHRGDSPPKVTHLIAYEPSR